MGSMMKDTDLYANAVFNQSIPDSMEPLVHRRCYRGNFYPLSTTIVNNWSPDLSRNWDLRSHPIPSVRPRPLFSTGNHCIFLKFGMNLQRYKGQK